MSPDEPARAPSRLELRWFGLLLGLFLALVGLLVFRAGGDAAARALWSAALAAVVLYYLAKPLRRPMHGAWMAATRPIGWIVTHLLFAITYYLVLTPTGLLLRLFGRNPLRGGRAESFWRERRRGDDPARYLRQF